MPIRCVTFNLKGLGDGWFDVRAQAVIEGLRPYQPDVVCLQEAGIRIGTPLYHQARVVGRALHLDHVVFSPYGNPLELIARDQGGIALLSRWPISDVRGRRLPSGQAGPSDARVALFATIASPDGRIGLVTTHLSWRPEEAETRLMQMGILLGELSRDPWEGEPLGVILAGDLNAAEHEPVIRAISEAMIDAYRSAHPREPGFTWVTANSLVQGYHLPDRRIDYIFCDRTASIRKCEVILNRAEPVQPSDHFGVYAELELDLR